MNTMKRRPLLRSLGKVTGKIKRAISSYYLLVVSLQQSADLASFHSIDVCWFTKQQKLNRYIKLVITISLLTFN